MTIKELDLQVLLEKDMKRATLLISAGRSLVLTIMEKRRIPNL